MDIDTDKPNPIKKKYIAYHTTQKKIKTMVDSLILKITNRPL